MNDKRAHSHVMETTTADQRRGCFGKVRFPSKKVAAAKARLLEQTDGLRWGEYKCRLCKGHHIGHAR